MECFLIFVSNVDLPLYGLSNFIINAFICVLYFCFSFSDIFYFDIKFSFLVGSF